MKVSGVEETESQQDTSRYAQRKLAPIHIYCKMSVSIWIRTPLHWKSAFRWGASHSFVFPCLCHSDSAANTSFILFI